MHDALLAHVRSPTPLLVGPRGRLTALPSWRYSRTVLRVMNVLGATVLAVSCQQGRRSEPPALTAGPGATEPSSARSEPTLSGPAVVLRPPGHPAVTVTAEVQRTDSQRARGLMFRRELDENRGMLFVFRESEHLTFWMHNTYLPLDMVFITSNMRVLGVVENAVPMTDDPREVPGDSQYVLEVRGGYAARHHIAAGTLVEFVSVGPALE